MKTLILKTKGGAFMSDGFSAQRRHAAKTHHCSCGKTIVRGEVYYSYAEFPGGGAGYADTAGHPVHMAVCMVCAIDSCDPRLIAARADKSEAAPTSITPGRSNGNG